MQKSLLAVGLVMIMLLFTACGNSSSKVSGSSSGGTITISSKGFTEQEILANMLKLLVENDTDLEVHERTCLIAICYLVRHHIAVWGGCRFVNDACNAQSLGNSGGRYDPSTNSWQPTTTTNAPTARTEHTAVWAGSEMIVWGGFDTARTKTGARYDPSTDTWTPTAANNKAPSARYWHTAVWTGSRMIVWGGYDGASLPERRRDLRPGLQPLEDPVGGRSTRRAGSPRRGLDRIADDRVGRLHRDPPRPVRLAVPQYGRPLHAPPTRGLQSSTMNAPVGRADPGAVWTGSRLVVWGGVGVGSVRTGGRYDPVADTWTPTNANEATSAREWHIGRLDRDRDDRVGRRRRFNGTAQHRRPVQRRPPTRGQPTAQTGAPAAPAIAHGGVDRHADGGVGRSSTAPRSFKTGGRYNPATNTWRPTSTTGAPVGPLEPHRGVDGHADARVGRQAGTTAFLNTGGAVRPRGQHVDADGTTGLPSAGTSTRRCGPAPR